MTEVIAVILCIVTIVYVILTFKMIKSFEQTLKLITEIADNTGKFLKKMKQDDMDMEKRHQEIMERIAHLITAKSEEIKQLIKT